MHLEPLPHVDSCCCRRWGITQLARPRAGQLLLGPSVGAGDARSVFEPIVVGVLFVPLCTQLLPRFTFSVVRPLYDEPEHLEGLLPQRVTTRALLRHPADLEHRPL